MVVEFESKLELERGEEVDRERRVLTVGTTNGRGGSRVVIVGEEVEHK